MLRNALSCFEAQLVLAHLADAMPADISYEEVAEAIKERSRSTPGTAPSLFEVLQERHIHLPLSDDVSCVTTSMYGSMTVFLLDIEGTTIPLPFVQQIMMPLADARIESYVANHLPADQGFVDLINAAVDPQSSPVAKTLSNSSETLAQTLAECKARDWKDDAMNEDARKHFCTFFREELSSGSTRTSIKAIQALIWSEVFAEGKLKSQVFPDVNTFFRHVGTPAMAKRACIALYSSGSIASQKLVMGCTQYGDLNPFITAYFDPALVGTKLMPKSYMKIRTLMAEKLGISPDTMQIVFVTDSTSEASAAKASGAVGASILCLRPLNNWITFETMASIHLPYILSFKQLMQRECEVDMAQLVVDTKRCIQEQDLS
ncbi:hypothetical protein JKF63_00872 [Porcisia hertigi]|uniref:Enolase-phosphatase E1 n=1 Tax=Porcisia hertigi TaxID=2761500 RepID=A0A836I911_9TRYP|nr:hypothetical protein JKF63_00872 [Porcisia hertigi]